MALSATEPLSRSGVIFASPLSWPRTAGVLKSITISSATGVSS